MHICIIKESRIPPDKRTPLTPIQLAGLKVQYPNHTFTVESSFERCYTNDEYRQQDIEVITDISQAEILIGIKEPDPECLQNDVTYLFFTHTTKQQLQNRKLLQSASGKNITLIDYEHLANKGARIVSFGYWAGIVGAYNALLGYGLQNDTFNLKPAGKCKGMDEIKKELGKVILPNGIKIIITGEGRVASGVTEILSLANIPSAIPESLLSGENNQTCYCQIGPQHYCKNKDGTPFDFNHFAKHPTQYKSTFNKYVSRTNILIAAHYWDPQSPKLFKLDKIKEPDFNVNLIADITCDINGSVPTTLRASSIDNPFYGINRQTLKECEPFTDKAITVMSVDNLPCALPREASNDFGNKLKKVIKELITNPDSQIISAAAILKNGKLTKQFSYLKEFLTGD